MHCVDHPQSEAVGFCGICGAGLCRDCFAGSMYTWDGKPLCPSCNVSLVRNLSAEAFRDALFGVFRVAFYAGLWTIAIWQYCVNHADLFVLFFWGGIGAFPTAWRALRPSLGMAFVNDVELYGNGNLAPWYFSFWFRVFASFVLGSLISPVFFFVALFQLVRALLHAHPRPQPLLAAEKPPPRRRPPAARARTLAADALHPLTRISRPRPPRSPNPPRRPERRVRKRPKTVSPPAWPPSTPASRRGRPRSNPPNADPIRHVRTRRTPFVPWIPPRIPDVGA